MYIPRLRIDRWTRTTRAGNGVVATRTNSDHERTWVRFSWLDSPAATAFSASPTTGFYEDGYDISVYLQGILYSISKNIVYRERRGKRARGDHARKSGAADKLMTSPERVGFPWETSSVSLARSVRRRCNRRWPGERRRAGTEFLRPASRPTANHEPSRAAPKRVYSFARRCRRLLNLRFAKSN